jgi:protein gp37
MSKIEWCDETWNPVTGCVKISAGCKNCFAERMARRLKAMGQTKYAAGFRPTYHPGALDEPTRWRKPRRVFVCSMSDLFQDFVPDSFIASVFDVMERCSQHTFQVLTKRPKRMAGVLGSWPTYPSEHIWLGTTVENADAVERICWLVATRARRRFLSCEPLLEDLGTLPLAAIDWVIVGGESGPGARPMDPDWARSIRDQCVAAGVPFFFKQHGGVNKKKAGRVLDGRIWDEVPCD